MRTADVVTQLRPRLSLRGRLYLFSGAILILFAINVAVSLWGSFARNESSLAYQEAVTAAQLTAELEQNLQNKRQQVLVLATLRETTDDPLEDSQLGQAGADLDIIAERLRQLGSYGGADLEAHYRRLHDSTTTLIAQWRQFYTGYNQAGPAPPVEDARTYNNAQQRLQELDQRQSFIAVQRATAIDRTITLTDQITVVGFISSIAITLALVFAIPVAFMAAKNTTPNKLILRPLALLIIVSSRSINSLIWALLLVSIIGPGIFAGTIAIALRSIGFTAKLLYEAIEEIDVNQVEAITATGASKAQIIAYGIVPQILPAFAGIVVFRWDINIRESTVLGLVGAGGIGLQLQSSLNILAWPQVTVILSLILVAVILSEWVSAKVRHAII